MASEPKNLSIRIGDRLVGPQEPVFVIAEAGVNHNGQVELAKQLVDAAVQASADAVKFQTFSAEALVTASAPKAEYQLQTTSAGESQLEMLRWLDRGRPIASCRCIATNAGSCFSRLRLMKVRWTFWIRSYGRHRGRPGSGRPRSVRDRKAFYAGQEFARPRSQSFAGAARTSMVSQ